MAAFMASNPLPRLLSKSVLLVSLQMAAMNSFAQDYPLTPAMTKFNSEQQAYPLTVASNLTAIQPGEQLILKLPEQAIVFTVLKVKQHLNGTTSVVVEQNMAAKDALTARQSMQKTSVITFKDSQTLNGHLRLADSRFLLKTNAQGVWLQKLGKEAGQGLGQQGESLNRQAVQIDHGGVVVPNRPAGEKSLRPARQMLVNGIPILDVMVLWDPALENRLGSAAAVETLIQQRVSMTNQAFADSQVNAEVRLVHTQQVDASDYTTNATILENLQQNLGVFDGVEALRAQHGADMVGFFRDFNQYTGSAGIAYRLGSEGEITDFDKDYAYFVVTDGEYQVGRTTYFSPENTFSHELGHNLGAEHDHSHAGNETPIFDYAYGHDEPGYFATIMSYESRDEVTESVMRYSNPNIVCTDGLACGVASGNYAADNARAFNQTASMIAAFLPSQYAYEGSKFEQTTENTNEGVEQTVQYLLNNTLVYQLSYLQEEISATQLDQQSGTTILSINGEQLSVSQEGILSYSSFGLFPLQGFTLPITYQVKDEKVRFTLDLTEQRLEF